MVGSDKEGKVEGARFHTSGTRDGDSADRSKNTRVPEPGMQVQSLGLAREGSKEKRQRTMVKGYGVLDKSGQVGGSKKGIKNLHVGRVGGHRAGIASEQDADESATLRRKPKVGKARQGSIITELLLLSFFFARRTRCTVHPHRKLHRTADVTSPPEAQYVAWRSRVIRILKI
jgi:hypothetical protein